MKHRDHQTAGGAGFTLIELLVVIGIMALIMAVTIPAFTGLGRATGLQTAAFQLNNTLALSRQMAISTRQGVYLVFPDDHAALYNSPHERHVEKAFRAYGVYAERDGYVGEWRMLPTGVILDPEYEKTPGSTVNFFQQGDRCMEDIPFPVADGPEREMFVVGFRADGPFHAGGIIPVDIFLREGWTEYNTESGEFEGWHVYPDTPVVGITIHAVTGQSRVREYDP